MTYGFKMAGDVTDTRSLGMMKEMEDELNRNIRVNIAGCHGQGKYLENEIFLGQGKVREFCGWPGKLRKQGCHSQGKISGKFNFFWVREKSGNFMDGQGH